MNNKQIRAATPDDAQDLVRFFRWAAEGLPDLIWAEMAEPGQSNDDVGVERAKREQGNFSYRNAHVIEEDGVVLAGVVHYRLPSDPVPITPDFPSAFVPFQDLENLAVGHWYINIIATKPDARGKGHGATLLSYAEECAIAHDCPGLALIVSASNPGAVRLYVRSGYEEVARRRLDIPGWPQSGTDAVLLMKPI